MGRRRATRRARRVQVHFWKQGDSTAYVGYTTNISLTGMFIATNSPMPSGTRIRIEVIERDQGFMVEAVVAHARKVRAELAPITQSGMGVRFLAVEELIRELMPAIFAATEEIPPNAERESYPPLADPEPVYTPPPAAPPAPPAEPAWEPPPAVAAPQRPAAPAASAAGAFSLRFASPDEFMEVYRRDILQGGLFVSTRYPARLQETVSVELHPPIAFAEPVVVRARVVHRLEPNAGGNPNAAGMGLELIDLPSLVERLEPIVQRLRA